MPIPVGLCLQVIVGEFFSPHPGQLALIAGIAAHLDLAYYLRTGGRLKKKKKALTIMQSMYSSPRAKELPAPVVPLLLTRLASSRLISRKATQSREIGTEKEKKASRFRKACVLCGISPGTLLSRYFFLADIYIPIGRSSASSNPSLASIITTSHHHLHLPQPDPQKTHRHV